MSALQSVFPDKSCILLDSNLLVLLIAGQVRSTLIPQLSPGKYAFEFDDVDIIGHLLLSFERQVTTPYLLSEVNSLLSKLDHNSMIECREKLAEYIPLLESRFREAADLATHQHFATFGITDISILLAAQNAVVVTEDGALLGLLQANHAVLNYVTLKQLILEAS